MYCLGETEGIIKQDSVLKGIRVQVIKIPFTSSMADRETDPAALEATHVYSPACRDATDSMVNCLIRFPELDTTKSI